MIITLIFQRHCCVDELDVLQGGNPLDKLKIGRRTNLSQKPIEIDSEEENDSEGPSKIDVVR